MGVTYFFKLDGIIRVEVRDVFAQVVDAVNEGLLDSFFIGKRLTPTRTHVAVVVQQFEKRRVSFNWLIEGRRASYSLFRVEFISYRGLHGRGGNSSGRIRSDGWNGSRGRLGFGHGEEN